MKRTNIVRLDPETSDEGTGALVLSYDDATSLITLTFGDGEVIGNWNGEELLDALKFLLERDN